MSCGPSAKQALEADLALPEASGELPVEPRELLALYDANSELDASVPQLETAVAALEKLIGDESVSDADAGEAQWRLARVCFMASEIDETRKTAWLEKGVLAGEDALLMLPERVEPNYFTAVIKGRLAEDEGLGALWRIKDVRALAQKAASLDPSFERGGPMRMLAMLYARAPGWPTSIGDIDKGLEIASDLVQKYPYPLNHLIYAEVLIEADENDDARKHLQFVIDAPLEGRWAKESLRWVKRARYLLELISS